MKEPFLPSGKVTISRPRAQASLGTRRHDYTRLSLVQRNGDLVKLLSARDGKQQALTEADLDDLAAKFRQRLCGCARESQNGVSSLDANAVHWTAGAHFFDL